ncbi:hypothetical protein B484DRAFT_150674 [Ochromonadaceae sp. CCMP2298]|nr:hypothetical protein B484DRAFT_150674 [Ochromonadaceae sp. CCMP2298]
MLVRLASVGAKRFLTFWENRCDALINLFSLIALIELSKTYLSTEYEYSKSGPHTVPLGWFLFIESGRLFKIFFMFNDVKIFEHMIAVLIRASFVYFSVIYFFAVFAFSFFCNALDPVAAEAADRSQDDAAQWVEYQNILNFKTLLQSIFTLFELSLLGNWSMVMDAAVATGRPVAAYLFFYTYRLTVTLFVLPILISFIIQVFLSALTLREKELAAEKEGRRLALKNPKRDGTGGAGSKTEVGRRRGWWRHSRLRRFYPQYSTFPVFSPFPEIPPAGDWSRDGCGCGYSYRHRRRHRDEYRYRHRHKYRCGRGAG